MKNVCLIIALFLSCLCASSANAQQYTWPYLLYGSPSCSPQYCYGSDNCPLGYYCQTYALGSQSCTYPHNIGLSDGLQANVSNCPYATYLLVYMTGEQFSEYYNYNPYTGVTGWIDPESLVATGTIYETIMGNLVDLFTAYAWEDCYNGTPGSFNTGNKPC